MSHSLSLMILIQWRWFRVWEGCRTFSLLNRPKKSIENKSPSKNTPLRVVVVAKIINGLPS